MTRHREPGIADQVRHRRRAHGNSAGLRPPTRCPAVPGSSRAAHEGEGAAGRDPRRVLADFTGARSVGEARWDEAQVVVQSLSSGERTGAGPGGQRRPVSADASPGLRARGQPARRGVRPRQADGHRCDSAAPAGGAAIIECGAGKGHGELWHVRTGTLVWLAGTARARPNLVWVDRDGVAERIETVPVGTTPRLSPDNRRVLVEAEGDLWT